MKWRGWMKWTVWVAVCLIIAGILVVGGCNLMVKTSARGKLYDEEQKIPYRKVGLLLGTAPKMANGTPNMYYQYRIEAASRLFHARKISYILISGDNCRHGYNEPEAMRQSLIAAGVPDTAIFLDYAGFRTYDSMVRAKKVFGQDSVTVISQYWHNERAVYLARRIGVDAIAYNASDVEHRRSFLKNHVREMLAKVKAVADPLLDKRPRFLGDAVPIPGGQSTAYKDSIRGLGRDAASFIYD